jgi:outer membrane protein assembly factor BamB
MISPSAGATISYDPATGKEYWRVRSGGMNASALPLFDGRLLFVNTAAGGFKMFAVRAGGSGDVTDTHIAWKNAKNMPTRPSQLLIDGRLFMVNDAGVVSCLDAVTGDALWQKRFEGAYSASPIYADGRIYFFSEKGDSPVIEPAAELKELAVNHMGDGFMASPAVSGKALYLRSRSHLYRVEKK